MKNFKKAWIVGWGSSYEDGSSSNALRNARLVVYDGNSNCNSYKKAGVYITNWTTQICAGAIESVDTCKGDSGGPLYFIISINFNFK